MIFLRNIAISMAWCKTVVTSLLMHWSYRSLAKGYQYVSCLRIKCKNMKFCLISEDETKRDEMLKKFRDYQRKAEMYYVYHSIQRYTVSYTILLNPSCIQLMLRKVNKNHWKPIICPAFINCSVMTDDDLETQGAVQGSHAVLISWKSPYIWSWVLRSWKSP